MSPPAMEYVVIVRADAPDRFRAQAVGIPEVSAVGRTEQEAIDQIHSSLAQWLASARLVRIQVPAGSGDDPWLTTFGRSADDPDFEEFVEEIRRNRETDPPE